MIRPEFLKRKLHLMAEDLSRLLRYKDCSLEDITGDFVKSATVERLLERIVMRAIDINEHIISESPIGVEDKTVRLTYRDTFLKLADIGVYPSVFAEQIGRSAGLRNILVHDYNDVDFNILHASIGSCLRDYEQYILHVYSFIEAREREDKP